MTDTHFNDADKDRDPGAAHWVVRIASGAMQSEERTRFEQWLDADPRNEEEFIEATVIWHALDEVEPAQVRAAVHRRAAGESSLADFKRAQAPRQPLWTFGLRRLAACVLITAVGGGAWMVLKDRSFPGEQRTVVTRTAEMRKVSFADGSVAHLNTRTKLEWVGDERERRVILYQGEALFDVAQETRRPFRVIVDDSEIAVIGTQFNVYRMDDGKVTVTVLNGAVQVSRREPAWSVQLHANEQVTVLPKGDVQPVRTAAAADAVQWRDGLLQMQKQPLHEVLRELARYTDDKIVIEDSRVEDVRVGGVFEIDDIPGALAGIEHEAPVQVTRRGNTFVLGFRDESKKRAAE